jgi:hypothetical protein
MRDRRPHSVRRRSNGYLYSLDVCIQHSTFGKRGEVLPGFDVARSGPYICIRLFSVKYRLKDVCFEGGGFGKITIRYGPRLIRWSWLLFGLRLSGSKNSGVEGVVGHAREELIKSSCPVTAVEIHQLTIRSVGLGRLFGGSTLSAAEEDEGRYG